MASCRFQPDHIQLAAQEASVVWPCWTAECTLGWERIIRVRGEVRDRCPAGSVLDTAKSSLVSQCSYLTLLRLHLQGKRGRQLKHESVSCVRHRAPQRSAGKKHKRERAGVHTAAGRDLRINSRAGFCFAHRWRILYRTIPYPLLSILSLFSTGVDLWGHEPVLRLLRSLLSADSNQWPRSRVVSGAIWDSFTRFPAALQLHCLEPLRHRHCPGHAEGARYTWARVILLHRSYSDSLGSCCEDWVKVVPPSRAYLNYALLIDMI